MKNAFSDNPQFPVEEGLEKLVTVKEHPLKKDEVELLRELSGGRYAWLRDAAGSLFLFGMTGFAVVTLLVRFLPLLGPLQYTIHAIAFTVCLYIAYSLGRSRARTSAGYFEDIGEGVALESTYGIEDAIRVREFEDFGAGYLMKLRGGGVLFMMGPHLYEPHGEGRFPCAEFTLREAPRSRLLFDFRCSGEHVEPSLVVEPFTKDDILSGNVPDDGAVYDIDFEALKFKLKTRDLLWSSVPRFSI